MNNIIASDSTFKLYQNVCYNKPDVIDEEHCYDLKLTFFDTTAAKANSDKVCANFTRQTFSRKEDQQVTAPTKNWRFRSTKLSASTELETKHKTSFNY